MKEDVEEVDYTGELLTAVHNKIEKSGTALFQKKYKNTKAELLGDSNDSGSFYFYIFPENSSQNVNFWDTNLLGIERQIEIEGFIILFDNEYTLSTFLNSSNLNKKTSEKNN